MLFCPLEAITIANFAIGKKETKNKFSKICFANLLIESDKSKSFLMKWRNMKWLMKKRKQKKRKDSSSITSW